MAIGGAGAATLVQADPGVARRAWPRWAALGVAMIAVALVAVLWDAAGARLLLGALGVFGAVRGALLARGAAGGDLEPRARTLGTGVAVAGLAALAVAAASAAASGWVLLVAAPVALVVTSLVLLGRGGAARRGGVVALVWSVLVAALLVVTGLAAGWERAVDGATVVGALAVGWFGVVMLVGAAGLRTAAARPAPPQPAGCAGCACAGGGCSVLPR
ncbi:hypothetical protein [Blastococcus sp. SYSU D00820]